MESNKLLTLYSDKGGNAPDLGWWQSSEELRLLNLKSSRMDYDWRFAHFGASRFGRLFPLWTHTGPHVLPGTCLDTTTSTSTTTTTSSPIPRALTRSPKQG